MTGGLSSRRRRRAYLRVRPQWVAPLLFAPSVQQPVFKQARCLSLHTHDAALHRDSQVSFHAEHELFANAGDMVAASAERVSASSVVLVVFFIGSLPWDEASIREDAVEILPLNASLSIQPYRRGIFASCPHLSDIGKK